MYVSEKSQLATVYGMRKRKTDKETKQVWRKIAQ